MYCVEVSVLCYMICRWGMPFDLGQVNRCSEEWKGKQFSTAQHETLCLKPNSFMIALFHASIKAKCEIENMSER